MSIFPWWLRIKIRFILINPRTFCFGYWRFLGVNNQDYPVGDYYFSLASTFFCRSRSVCGKLCHLIDVLLIM